MKANEKINYGPVSALGAMKGWNDQSFLFLGAGVFVAIGGGLISDAIFFVGVAIFILGIAIKIKYKMSLRQRFARRSAELEAYDAAVLEFVDRAFADSVQESMKAIGISAEEIQERAPLRIAGYLPDDNHNAYPGYGYGNGILRSKTVMVSTILFAEESLFVVMEKFYPTNVNERGRAEGTWAEIKYADITDFELASAGFNTYENPGAKNVMINFLRIGNAEGSEEIPYHPSYNLETIYDELVDFINAKNGN